MLKRQLNAIYIAPHKFITLSSHSHVSMSKCLSMWLSIPQVQHIHSLEMDSRRKDETINAQQTQITSQQAQLSSQQANMSNYEAHLSSQQLLINTLKSENNALKTKDISLDTQISKITADINTVKHIESWISFPAWSVCWGWHLQ